MAAGDRPPGIGVHMYRSTDGGASWRDITGAVFNGHECAEVGGRRAQRWAHPRRDIDRRRAIVHALSGADCGEAGRCHSRGHGSAACSASCFSGMRFCGAPKAGTAFHPPAQSSPLLPCRPRVTARLCPTFGAARRWWAPIRATCWRRRMPSGSSGGRCAACPPRSSAWRCRGRAPPLSCTEGARPSWPALACTATFVPYRSGVHSQPCCVVMHRSPARFYSSCPRLRHAVRCASPATHRPSIQALGVQAGNTNKDPSRWGREHGTAHMVLRNRSRSRRCTFRMLWFSMSSTACRGTHAEAVQGLV